MHGARRTNVVALAPVEDSMGLFTGVSVQELDAIEHRLEIQHDDSASAPALLPTAHRTPCSAAVAAIEHLPE